MSTAFRSCDLLLVIVAGVVATGLIIVMWKARKDMRAVEHALFREVVALRWQAATVAAELARRHAAGEPFDSRFFALFPLSEPLIYPSTGAAVLSKLPSEIQGRLGYFHAQLTGARARMKDARRSGHFEPTPYRMLSSLVRAYYEIDPWVRALRKGGAPAIDEPEIVTANDLLGRFEDDLSEPLVAAYCWVDSAHI